MLKWLNSYGAKTSSSLFVHLKLKCLLKKPTDDDSIELKEVYIQQAFGRYKGKLVSVSIYLHNEHYVFTSAGFNKSTI